MLDPGEPAARPQSTPAGAGHGGLGDLAEERKASMRPQTARPERGAFPVPPAGPFKAPLSRPQSREGGAMLMRQADSRAPVADFDPAIKAHTPPWVFTKPFSISSSMLKTEYEAMANKAVEDEKFNQKMNQRKPTPEVHHMKKDWRYYQHCGSKGNVWSDLHMTPEDRRHLVVTPTVLRGYDQQMRTVAKHLRAEQEVVATRMERIVYERQLRRFRLQEQQTFREELEIRASQRPPSQHGMPQSGGSDPSFSRPSTAATLVRPSPASTQQPQPLSQQPQQPQPQQPQQRPSTAPSEVSAASGRSGVPTLKGMAAFGGLQLDQDQGNQLPVASLALAPTGARPIYGVHVEYPPDYDFNIGGTGLHGWGDAGGRTILHGSQGGVGVAARGKGSAKAKESSVQSIQAPTKTPAHASRSDFGPQSASEVVQPASVLPGRQFQANFDYTTMLTKDQWIKATARRDTTRAKIAWELARPDLNEWAQAHHDAKAAREEAYMEEKRSILQVKRQDRRHALKDRMRDRAALEAEAGQDKARERDLVRQKTVDQTNFSHNNSRNNMPIWRPSGYGNAPQDHQRFMIFSES